MRRSSVLGVSLLLGLGGLVGACSQPKDDPEDVKADLVTSLEEDGGLTADQAECFADVLIDEVGADELADVDFTADAPPEDLQDDFAKAGQRALEDCDLPDGSAGG